MIYSKGRLFPWFSTTVGLISQLQVSSLAQNKRKDKTEWHLACTLSTISTILFITCNWYKIWIRVRNLEYYQHIESMYRCIGKLQFELHANSKSYFDKNERTNCILHYDDRNKIITDLRCAYEERCSKLL